MKYTKQTLLQDLYEGTCQSTKMTSEQKEIINQIKNPQLMQDMYENFCYNKY